MLHAAVLFGRCCSVLLSGGEEITHCFLLPPCKRGRAVNIHCAGDKANTELNWNLAAEARWHTLVQPFKKPCAASLPLYWCILRSNTHLLPQHCNNIITITKLFFFFILNRRIVSGFETNSSERDDDCYFYHHQRGSAIYVETTHKSTK